MSSNSPHSVMVESILASAVLGVSLLLTKVIRTVVIISKNMSGAVCNVVLKF
jgi:hypothetical protein